jgi:sugar (pentulose or hexulose) kinase
LKIENKTNLKLKKMEVLGIDIGGTGIKGAIVNTENGTLTT